MHDSNTNCNFYGVQYDASITGVFNSNPLQKKTYISLGELSNTVWSCPEITTSMYSFGTTNQSSSLTSGNFELLEGVYHASFRMDANSVGGRINGNALKGNWIEIKFLVSNASDFVTLNLVSLKYINSPLTTT